MRDGYLVTFHKNNYLYSGEWISSDKYVEFDLTYVFLILWNATKKPSVTNFVKCSIKNHHQHQAPLHIRNPVAVS